MKVVVTGAASDFATVILPRLLEDPEIDEVLGVDLRKPRVTHAKLGFECEDVRSPRLSALFEGARVVVHLAYIVGEIRDKDLTHDINIGGSRNVIRAAHSAGVERLVMASSVSAYGAHADYPRPVAEGEFPRGNHDKYYFYDKAEVEHYVEWWERRNPGARLKIARLRPATIVGPSIDNDLVRLLAARLAVYPKPASPLQLTHEDDLADAFHRAVKNNVSGPFNLGKDDWLDIEELAAIHGQRLVRLPLKLGEALADLGYRLHLSPVSGNWVTPGDPIVSGERAKKELGWRPVFSTLEAAHIHLVQHGRPILNGRQVGERAEPVLKRKEVAEAALEPVTRTIKGWVESVPGLTRALGRPEEIDRMVDRLEHEFIYYRDLAVHLEVHPAGPDGSLAGADEQSTGSGRHSADPGKLPVDYERHPVDPSKLHADANGHPGDSKRPTVVFSPGLGAHARFYLPALGKLCDEGFNVVGIDRPGHGLSEGARGVCAFERILDVVEMAVRYARERFGGPVVLAGSSLGGIITWFALTREPDIEAAICHSVAHPNVYHEPSMRLKAPLLRKLGRFARHAPIPIKQIADFDAVTREPSIADWFDSQADHIWAWTVSANAAAGLLDYVPPLDWPEVRIPTLVMVGADDEMVTPAFTEKVLARAKPPTARLQIMPGCGHLLFHDHLAETLPVFLEFIRCTFAEQREPVAGAG